MQIRKKRFNPSIRGIALLLVYTAGLMSIVATGGGSGGGSDDPPDPPPPNTTVGSIEVAEASVNVGETVTIAVTVRNTDGNIIDNPSLTFELDLGTLASVSQSGEITGIASGAAQLTVSSGAESDSADIYILESRPFAWPVDRMRSDEAWSLLSQGYAEYGDVVPDRYHTGMDVRVEVPAGYVSGQESGVSDSQVRAVASGSVRRIQRNVSESENPEPPPTPDHDMGNTIVIAHQMEGSDDGVIYSQYSHLADDGFGQGLLEEAIALSQSNSGCTSDQEKTVSGENVPSEYICDPGALVVSKGDLLGHAGDTGEEYFLHLHYELKSHNNGLGNDADSRWGYTDAASLVEDGFVDPIPYFFEDDDYVFSSEILEVTQEGDGFPMRMGPGGHVEMVGTRTINGRYRSIWEPLMAGTPFTAVATVGKIDDLLVDYDSSQVDLVECDQGWVALRKMDFGRFTDGERLEGTADDSGEFDVAWACLGHGTVAYLEPATGIAAPTGLSAVAQSTSEIRVSWIASSGATSYSLYRGGSTTPISTGTATEFIDSGLQAGTEYCYQVRAVDGQDNPSPLSEEVCETTESISDTEPPGPFTLTATVVSSNQIDLSWTEAVDNVATVRYEVLRDQALIGTTAALTYSDSGLLPDTEYCYVVTAYDAADNPRDSNEECATTLTDVVTLDPPTIESVSVVSDTSLQVTWSNPATNIDVDTFRLYRDGAEVFVGNALTFLDEQLTSSTQYCYQVQAENTSGVLSDLSNEICATTEASGPPLELAIVSSVDPVDDGTDLTITMTISNPGSVTRNNVLLEAVMPDYMSPAETATSPVGNCIGFNGSCPSGETMQWTLGNLAAGEQYVVSYTDTVSTSADDGALLTAIASVTADGIASIQDSHTVVVSDAAPPYQVGVNADENPAGPGEEFRYRIRYSNRSAAIADRLSLTLSDDVTFVSGTGGASPTGQIVTWPALSVAAGDNGLEEVTVMVNAGEPAGRLLRTEAAFGITNSQATGANVVAVNAAPPLELAIVSSVDPVDDGTDLTITMTISNPGSVTRNNVLLEAVMPDYMSPAETATSPVGNCIGFNGSCPSGETMQWTLGNLAAGEQYVVSYTDTVSTSADDGALLTAIASVTADGIASIQDSHTVVVSDAAPPYQVGVNADENPAGPGEEFRYRIRYSNRSAAIADRLSLTLSDDVTFVSGTGGASPTGQIVTWPALSVAAGDNGLEEVTVMVNAGEPAGRLLRTEAAFGITNSQATGANVVAVNAAPPLELAIVSSVDPVDDGTDLTITMTISNPGSVTRNNVLLEAVMPDYMSPAETATSPVGNCIGFNGSCPSGETMQWTLGNLAAGEQYVVSYTDTVSTSADDGALLTAIASVTADGIASIQDSHTVVVSDAAPPYQVGVNADENPAGPGEEFRYRIRYSNRSAAIADRLSLTLSDDVTFVSGTGGASPTGQIVTWPALSVAAGDNGLEEVTVMVNAGEPAGRLLRTEAAFGITNSQATGANVVAVNAAPPLELAIVSSVDPVDDGTDLTITMTISNPGSVTRNNVLLEAVMPDYMSPAETATSPVGNCIGFNGSCPSGETMQWTLGNLAAGEQYVVSYTDTVSTSADDGALLTAIASVTADGIASIQDSHTVVVSDAAPPYQVGVNADENPAGPGEEFRYRIRYSNRSAAIADRLSLTLSDDVTFVSGTGGASPTGQIVTWPALSVAAGDNGLEEVTVMVNAGEPAGRLLRTEAAFGITNSQATGANVVAVNAAPPLELAIVSSVDPVDDGTDLTITMTISNPGSVTRNNVLLEAVMPDYMSPAETATSPVGNCIGFNGSCPSGETMQWTLGNLAAGEQYVVSYTDTVSTSADDGALLTAIASVTADGIASIQDSHTVVVIE